VKKTINDVCINGTITRQELLRSVKFQKEITIDLYRADITRAGFLKWIRPGLYQKVEHIPENLSITKLRKYLTDRTWRKWFIPREEYLGIKKKGPKNGNKKTNPL
jgi:hypothetical protein